MAFDDLAVLRAFGINVNGFTQHNYFFGARTDLELCVHAERGIDVDHETSLPIELEPVGFDLDVVCADG